MKRILIISLLLNLFACNSQEYYSNEDVTIQGIETNKDNHNFFVIYSVPGETTYYSSGVEIIKQKADTLYISVKRCKIKNNCGKVEFPSNYIKNSEFLIKLNKYRPLYNFVSINSVNPVKTIIVQSK